MNTNLSEAMNELLASGCWQCAIKKAKPWELEEIKKALTEQPPTVLDSVDADAYALSNEELTRTDGRCPVLYINGIRQGQTYYSRESVERLLAEHRKQVLLETAKEIDAKFSVIEQHVTEHSEWTYQCGHPQISDELRRMAELDKGGNESFNYGEDT